ncbi:hypothetical protein CYMTET_8781 [Cymbomonas tetramitiformis]|uniref:CNNM transmembrane domain-containing protein n=1 Tax=Cymbomonas tetramitiformis TaxID=36881 RepID=A0AAE0GSX8_9CHLO|nr:hypothetical protein CYMTET_8781 [Cymbomonas tetramitiformis]
MAIGLAGSLCAIKPVRSVREPYRKNSRGLKREDRSSKTRVTKLEGLASTFISRKSRADPRKVLAPVVVCKSHANSNDASEARFKACRKVPQNVQTIIQAVSCAIRLSWALKLAKQFGVTTFRVLRTSTVRARAALAPLAVFLVWAAHAAPSALASGGFGPRAGAGAAQAAAWHEVSGQLLGGTVLLIALAFFSLSETSITTLWPWKVRELAEKEGDGSPFHLVKSDISRFLTTILIGSTISAIGATALVTDAAFKGTAAPLGHCVRFTNLPEAVPPPSNDSVYMRSPGPETTTSVPRALYAHFRP